MRMTLNHDRNLKKCLFFALTLLLFIGYFLSIKVSAQTIDGDINNDGKIDVYDAIIISRHVLGIEILSNEFLNAADINGDGVIDVRDVVLVMKKVVEKEYSDNYIVTVTKVDALEVPYGTNQKNLDFPERVLVVLNDGRKIYVIVIWDDFSVPSYDPLAVGKYVFRGSLVNLPGGLKNPDNLLARVNVLVYIPSQHETEPPIATQ